MSDWTVHLEFEEGTSSKFWRARVEGKTLYVNYGKIGTNGQTQVKDFADRAGAAKEYEKLVREKRKKGYVDSGGERAEGDEDEELEEAAAAPPAAQPARGGGLRMVLEAGPRRVEAQLFLDGKTVRMDAAESHATPEAARKAYERLKKTLAGEGYREG